MGRCLASGNWYALTGKRQRDPDLGAISFASGSGFDLNLPAYSVNTITLTLLCAVAPGGHCRQHPGRDLAGSGQESLPLRRALQQYAVLDADSINGDEIQVTGPTGLLTVTLVGISVAPNGKSIDATYRLTPPEEAGPPMTVAPTRLPPGGYGYR